MTVRLQISEGRCQELLKYKKGMTIRGTGSWHLCPLGDSLPGRSEQSLAKYMLIMNSL